MKVAVVTGPGTVELRDEPRPTVGPDELLVEVGACGLCTMERRLFTGEKQLYPVAPGHEVAGRVIEAGEAVATLAGSPRVGDAVTVDLLTRCGTCSCCRRGRSAICKQPQGGALRDGTISMGAGLAEYVIVAARQAYATGGAPIELASMGEPLACVAHSVRLSGFRAGDRVAIIGGGYMGRLHLALTRATGAAQVGVVDVSETRLDEARAAGAAWTATPESALANGTNDVVFVTAGAPGALELALQLADDAGTIVLYGAFPERADRAGCARRDPPSRALDHRRIQPGTRRLAHGRRVHPVGRAGRRPRRARHRALRARRRRRRAEARVDKPRVPRPRRRLIGRRVVA